MRRIQFGIGIGEDADGKSIPRLESDRMIRSALLHLGRFFGGGFITRGHGFWVPPHANGAIIEEGITITIDTDEPDGTVKSVAEMLRAIFNQTAVHVYIGSTIQSYDHTRS